MKVQAITAIITNPKKGFMLYRRDDGNGKTIPYPDTWSFFGGTVEYGETYLECLVREMNEELELKLDPDQCKEIFVYDHDSGTDHVFHCPINDDSDLRLHEGREKAWMPLDQIKNTKLAWCQEQVIPYLEKLAL